MSDTTYIIVWWFTIFVLGLICFPITSLLFKRFFDKGYIFAKIIGIILTSYIVWLTGSLHILPFNRLPLMIIVLGVALANMIILTQANKNHPEGTKYPWLIFIFEEVVFLVALSFWSYVRATEPSIRGLEKFMDYGFVNSILRSNFFPPLDMWLTKSPDYTGGYFINYYYYGHYINAFLTKLSGIDSTITYNLMIATLFAFTFSLSFSLGGNLINFFLRNLKKPDKESSYFLGIFTVIAGLLAAFIVTFGGNLHTIYVFTSGYPNEKPQPVWELSVGYHPDRYWYPNATRFIPFTIHEFPIYSFVVADLHGHVSDIPMVFLLLAILLHVTTSKSNDELNGKNKNKGEIQDVKNNTSGVISEFENHTSISLPIIILLGLLTAIMYMTNAWDGLIYLILSALVIFYKNLRRIAYNPQISVFKACYKTFSALLFLIFFFLVFGLPFFLSFIPFASSIGVLCAPKALIGKSVLGKILFEEGKCQKSDFYMLALLWGFFYINVIGFITMIIIPKIKSITNSIQKPPQTKALNSFRQNRLITILRDMNEIDVFVSILIFISTLLLVFPEFFYLKDIYPAHYRANTMFKLGYQAFMMLGICSAYIVIRLKNEFPGRFKDISYVFYRSIFILAFTLVAIYPYFAINSYYNGLRRYEGLYGLNWLLTQYPDDYKAIIWLRQNIKCTDVLGQQCNNQPVIVEANGDSYTDYGRVSAYTGLPTIVGWPVHEWLWRGSYDEAGRRIPEVAKVYESKDEKETMAIIKKYNVEYIFLGSLEREKYKNIDDDELEKMGKVVFQSGNTKVYKVNI